MGDVNPTSSSRGAGATAPGCSGSATPTASIPEVTEDEVARVKSDQIAFLRKQRATKFGPEEDEEQSDDTEDPRHVTRVRDICVTFIGSIYGGGGNGTKRCGSVNMI